MSRVVDPEVAARFEVLFREFEAAAEAESPEQQEQALLLLLLRCERLRHGCSDPGPQRDALDEQTLSALKTARLDEPALSVQECVFRRFDLPATGEGVRYLDRSVSAISAAQKARAKKERLSKQSQITRDLRLIAEENAGYAISQVRAELVESGYTFREGDILGPDGALAMRADRLYQRWSEAKKFVQRSCDSG